VTTTPKSRRWTVDELRQLSNLAARGVPEDEIARTLGRTVRAVRTKAAHQRLWVLADIDIGFVAPQERAMSGRLGSAPPSHAKAGPRDYVVLYQRHPAAGSPRVSLIRLLDGGTHHLIRTTFEAAEEAGPRFEDQAQRMAAAAATSAFRCVDGVYTPLDAKVDDDDA